MTLEIVKVVGAILIPFVILFLGTIIAVFRYFLKQFADDIKREFAQLEASIEKNDERVNQVERDFMAFQVQLPKEYVLRQDHIRIIALFEKRVDKLGDVIMAMDLTLQGQQVEVKLLLSQIGESDAKRKEQNP